MGAAILLGLLRVPRVWAQSAANDWEKAAGGKMSFDVASVKRDMACTPQGGVLGSRDKAAYTNFDWFDDTEPKPTSLFSAKRVRLNTYIAFAYKIGVSPMQNPVPNAPKWVSTECFDVDARSSIDATRDQMRLMMQSLLADRFKLTAHWKAQSEPVLVLSLVRPGRLGPELHQDTDPTPCADQAPIAGEPMATIAGGYPAYCGGLIGVGTKLVGRMTMAAFAKSIGSSVTLGFNRPVIDQTGLSGVFDMKITYTVEPLGNQPSSEDFQVGFTQALKDQLGLKLESASGPVNEIVVDHVEEPSAN